MKVNLLESLGIPEELIANYAEDIVDMGHEFEYFDQKSTDPDTLIKRSRDADIVMIANNPYPGEVIEECTNLKLINVAFTGVDHVCLAAAKRQNIKVCNARGYSDIAVSEHVMGLTLDLYRKISLGNAEVRSGGIGRIGYEIHGKTVGIIGTGNIGLRTAELFRAFGANIIAYSRSVKSESIDLGLLYTELDDLLQLSDIITIHLPLNEHTRGFIGKRELGLMKRDSILINCARGPIVDNNALSTALMEGWIAGAGVDVFDMEPPIPEDYPLMNINNLIATPHVAYLTEEAMLHRAQIAFENTIAFLNGKAQNLVQL